MQELSGASHTGVGWVMQKNNLKTDSPQNQDLTPPKSFLEGYKICILNIKIIIIIILLLLSCPDLIFDYNSDTIVDDKTCF